VGKVALSIWFAFVNDDVLEYMIFRCDSSDCNFKILSSTLELLQCYVYYQCSTICVSLAGSMNSYTQEVCLWWKQCNSNLLKSCNFYSLHIIEVFMVVHFQMQQNTELLILILHSPYTLFTSRFLTNMCTTFCIQKVVHKSVNKRWYELLFFFHILWIIHHDILV